MTKTKFNLNFGGEQIRTLDDLRENFSIEDVLRDYRSGTLVRWLDSRNYTDELEQVIAIQATGLKNAQGILAALIHVFQVEANPSEVESGISLDEYLKTQTPDVNVEDEQRDPTSHGQHNTISIEWKNLPFGCNGSIEHAASDGSRWLLGKPFSNILSNLFDDLFTSVFNASSSPSSQTADFCLIDEKYNITPFSLPETFGGGFHPFHALLKYEHSTWMIGGKNALWVSEDLKLWKSIPWPEYKGPNECDIVFADGQWILIMKTDEEAHYVKKGFFLDSDGYTSWNPLRVYRAKTLGDKWDLFKEASAFPTGMELSLNIKDSPIAFANGTAVASFEYQRSYYAATKHLLKAKFGFGWNKVYSQLLSQLACISDRQLEWYAAVLSEKGWQSFYPPVGEMEGDNYSFKTFWSWGNLFIAKGEKGLYTSKNGYDWDLVFERKLIDLHLIPLRDGFMLSLSGNDEHYDNKAYFSTNAKEYQEFALCEKSTNSVLRILASDGKDRLLASIYDKSQDKSFLRLGKVSIQDI